MSLVDLASYAAGVIPGAAGVGLLLSQPGGWEVMAASSPLVQEVDEAQCLLGEGPAVTAVEQDRTVVSVSLVDDGAWPQFAATAGTLELASALCVPVRAADRVLGALTVYARRREVFGEGAVSSAELLATPAAVAMQLACALRDSRREIAQLELALVNRAVIDQAIGIMISRQGGTAEASFGVLRSMSQDGNTKLAALARTIVEEAGRRARARHRPGVTDQPVPDEPVPDQ